MLEGANFILLKGLWDAHGVSCRAAEPIGRCAALATGV